VITIDGQSYQPTGTQGHAVYLNLGGGYTSTITTGATAATAVSISGIVTSGASSTDNAYGVLSWLSSGSLAIKATGADGDIAISGVAATSTLDALALNKTNISATSGNISLNGGSQRIAFGQQAANIIGGAAAAADHTGDVNICAGNVAFSSGSTSTIRTAGSLVIEPCSGSFTASQSWSSADVTMAAGSARFGRTGNMAGITVSVPLTLTGDLDVIGGAITYNGTGVTTTAGGNININSSGLVTGPAAFNANGSVAITGTSYTGTGALTSAGADGISITSTSGVTTASSSGIRATGTGDITITSAGAYTGSAPVNANGNVVISASTFDGTGTLTSAGADGISVIATAGDLDTGANMTANTSATAPIVLKATGNVLLSDSLTSAGGPITLWSDSDDVAYGGILTTSASRIVSNGGAVTLAGGADVTTGFAKATATVTSAAGVGYSGVRLTGRITAGDGDVVIRGQDNPTISNSNYVAGVEIEKSSLISTTKGDITIVGKNGNAATGTSNHWGTIVGNRGTEVVGTTNIISSTEGNISITGDATALSHTRSYGLGFYETSISSTIGSIILEGLGVAGSADDIYWNGRCDIRDCNLQHHFCRGD
jgi:filamentous hemagglutinin